jgi:hypothetical protein
MLGFAWAVDCVPVGSARVLATTPSNADTD